MQLSLLYLFTSIFGFITIYLIGFQFKNNRNTNIFLAYLILLSSLRFLKLGIPDVFSKESNGYFELLFVLNAWLTLYLYFTKLSSNTKIHLKDLLHYIVPYAIFAIYCVKDSITNLELIVIIKKCSFVYIVISNLVYSIMSYKFLSKNVWNRNSDILLITQQNKFLSKWTKFLFVLFFLMFIRVCIDLILNNDNKYLWVASLIWIIMYARIICSPEFLYGYEVFQNKIKEYQKHKIIFDNVWLSDVSKEIINIQDNILKEKIDSLVMSYVVEIEHVALNSDFFFSHNLTIDDLAIKLNLPKSHLIYVFKYHSSISFPEFKKIIRIQKTISLIEDGFLKNSTLEALANKVGFSSYSSFFKSFKNITGDSPHEYLQKIK